MQCTYFVVVTVLFQLLAKQTYVLKLLYYVSDLLTSTHEHVRNNFIHSLYTTPITLALQLQTYFHCPGIDKKYVSSDIPFIGLISKIGLSVVFF